MSTTNAINSLAWFQNGEYGIQLQQLQAQEIACMVHVQIKKTWMQMVYAIAPAFQKMCAC